VNTWPGHIFFILVDIQGSDQVFRTKVFKPANKAACIGHTQTTNHNPLCTGVQPVDDVLVATHTATGLYRLRRLAKQPEQGGSIGISAVSRGRKIHNMQPLGACISIAAGQFIR